MWHRLSNTNNTTTTITSSRQSPAVNLTSQNKPSRVQSRQSAHIGSARNEPDRKFWQDRFEDRLKRLATPAEDSNQPRRFEIRQGKAVPSASDSPLAPREYLPSSTSSSTPEAAPRPRQFPRSSEWRQSALPPSHVHTQAAIPKLVVDDDHCDKSQQDDPTHQRSGSRLSDEMNSHFGQAQRRETNTDGVSLPSSPELSPEESPAYDETSVSPIDEDDADGSQQQVFKGPPNPLGQHLAAVPPTAPSHAAQPSAHHQPSSIPTMRREKGQQQSDADAVAPRPRANRDSHLRAATPPIPSGRTSRNAVGWDDPTAQTYPRPDSTEPRKEGQTYGMTTTVTAQLGQRTRNPPPSLGQRVRQQLGKGKMDPIESRPAWNGASGRETVVQPVHDNTAVPPLQVPPMSSKRAERARDARSTHTQQVQQPPKRQQGYDVSHGSSTMAALRKFMPHRHGQAPPQPSGRVSPAARPATSDVAAAETPPRSKASMNAPPPIDAQDFAPQIRVSPNPPRLTIPNPDKAIKRKPPPNAANTPAHVVHPSISSSVYSAQPDQTTLTAPPRQTTSNPPLLDDSWTQPPSRFSVATYATSANDAAARHSDEEDAPPVPEPSSSVMDRRRPVPGRNSPPTVVPHEPVVISLKSATLSEHSSTPRSVANDKTGGRPMSVLSTSKDLPPAPPEMVETTDRVVMLNAKLEALAHRRNNISKSIKQMTELMPADRLMASNEVLRKREEEKKKVDALRVELSEVQRQEYELGLKLHRAYKRQDREANYETGTLWVRRVTS